MVTDLQGVKMKKKGSPPKFVLTDPAIHSYSYSFGVTDQGMKGFFRYFRTHVCNQICKSLELKSNEKC